jgi:hypothetical protein
LQFAATRLWDSRDRTRKVLTIAAYEQMGGVGGAFARHADEVAAAVPPQNQALLRAIMTRLVTPEGTRAVIDHKELLGLSDDRAEVESILDQLVRARLVSLHTDPNQGATVEIVHEVLITEWPMLGRWLEDSQALRGFMQELRQAVRQWISRGKPNDLVWRGATAQEALGLAKRHVLELSAGEKEFLQAVRVESGRSRRRKVLAIASIFTVLALVIAGGAFWVVQISQAKAEVQKAEGEAQLKAIAADKEAKRAREAEAKVQAQLDAVKKAEADRKSAEDVATRANETVAQTQGDLQKANEELKKALADSQQDKLTAQELARKAALAAELAKKATDEAKAANAKLSTLLAVEKERVHKLELEKAKISTGGLK